MPITAGQCRAARGIVEMSQTTLAEAANVSRATVNSRIQRLVDSQVILGFTALVNDASEPAAVRALRRYHSGSPPPSFHHDPRPRKRHSLIKRLSHARLQGKHRGAHVSMVIPPDGRGRGAGSHPVLAVEPGAAAASDGAGLFTQD